MHLAAVLGGGSGGGGGSSCGPTPAPACLLGGARLADRHVALVWRLVWRLLVRVEVRPPLGRSLRCRLHASCT